MVKTRPALFFFPRTQLSLVVLVDLGQQSGVDGVPQEKACFLDYSIKKVVKIKLQMVWFSKISK